MEISENSPANTETEYTLDGLKNRCFKQEFQIEELTAKLNWYEEQFRLSQQKRFGTSSEKTDIDQLNFLFDEAEKEADSKIPEPTVEEITYKRKKQVGKREADLKKLPVEVIEYRLTDEELICDQCGNILHEMTTEIRQELKIIPAKVVVVKHIKYVYSCRDCEQNEIKTPVITAPMPKSILPGSLVSPSLMAYIMVQKYVNAMPLYRQEQMFGRLDIEISRQNMANWMMHGGNDWLKILYDRLHVNLLKNDILHADETRLQVLNEPGRSAQSDSYMWLYRTGVDNETQIVLYEYQTTRAGKYPRKFLENFKGYLHVDGYAGYHGIPNVKLVGCWAHARRYFTDTLKSMPDKKSKAALEATKGLNFCNQLFSIEHATSVLTGEERFEARLEKSKPLLEAFSSWLNIQSKRVLPKSALGKAITYCRNQWTNLETFLLDGRLELTNNRAERSIKPFVIGRKNWLFSNSQRGARASAIIYSIIETAEENDLKPYEYLTYLFEQLPNTDITDVNSLDKLLPWSATIPENCKAPAETEAEKLESAKA